MADRPTVGTLEERTAPPIAPAPAVDGRRLRGVIPYGVESRDMGGWREVMQRGSLAKANTSDLVATVDHAGVPLARFPTTLEIEHRDDGLHWSLELPESRAEIREAIERGDLRSTSWRMVVGKDRWSGNVRHVEEVRELRDVAIATNPAYAEARAEYRARPETETPPPDPAATEEEPVKPEEKPAGGLTVEDRAAPPEGEERTVEQRVVDAIRSVPQGESRSLTVTGAEPIEPPELSTLLFDKLRPGAIALASGMRVHPTSNRKVVFPQITSDVDPTWVAAGEEIPEGTPGITALEAEPKKLAHRAEVENEVLDDSEPSAQDLLDRHLATMLALKLDRSIFEGNPTSDPDSIRGLKFLTGIQEIVVGAPDGDALDNYDVFIRAVGMLRDANVNGPLAIASNPRTLTDLELLKKETGSNEQLPAPANLPPFFTSSQLSKAETIGANNDSASAYVYAPGQFWVVNRLDAEILIDRSRLFHRDMSEMRAKLRCDFMAPNPVACVRIRGIRPLGS
jgi:HK97 family phage major capsid protein